MIRANKAGTTGSSFTIVDKTTNNSGQNFPSLTATQDADGFMLVASGTQTGTNAMALNGEDVTFDVNSNPQTGAQVCAYFGSIKSGDIITFSPQTSGWNYSTCNIMTIKFE